jgi:transcription antitermination factor NusG
MSSDEHWYAVYCKSRHERRVHDRLTVKGVASYLADYETRVQWGARLRKFRKNLLPGYVLVQARLDPKIYLAILQTESVVKFVGRPWPKLSWIPDEQVQSLRLLLESSHQFEEIPYFNAGDKVEVIAGALAGLQGLINGPANPKHRVIVSIELLRRSVALEIDACLLRRVQGALEPEEVWE